MNARMSYVVWLVNYIVEQGGDKRAAESFALSSLTVWDRAFEAQRLARAMQRHPVDVLDDYIRSAGLPLADDYEDKIAALRAMADEEIAL